ncbi:hypothetical protein M758_12G125600 [Ceratodon purpureus]|nr:hypothetical protein M758_12G125600 [Ceratodon purpureus]
MRFASDAISVLHYDLQLRRLEIPNLVITVFTGMKLKRPSMESDLNTSCSSSTLYFFSS